MTRVVFPRVGQQDGRGRRVDLGQRPRALRGREVEHDVRVIDAVGRRLVHPHRDIGVAWAHEELRVLDVGGHKVRPALIWRASARVQDPVGDQPLVVVLDVHEY